MRAQRAVLREITETFVEEIPAAEDTKPKKKVPSKKKETLSTDE